MKGNTLEDRLRTLEQEIRVIKERLDQLAGPRRETDVRWKQTVGMFRGDPLFKEVLEGGRAIRESEGEP